MPSAYEKDTRQLLEKALEARWPKIPRPFQEQFKTYQKPLIFKYLLQVNLLAQLTFLLYGVVDWILIPDVQFLSIFWRVIATSLTFIITLWIYFRVQSIQVFDLLLPISSTIAAFIWLYLLTLSDSPHVISYQYGALIFILLANLCVQFQFLPAFICSLIISLCVFAGSYEIHHGNWHAVFVVFVVYAPIFLFSLYISWNSTSKSRILFLRFLLEDLHRKALDYLAHTDELTGLHNRRHFEQLSEREMLYVQRFGEKLCLIIFDIDRFKAVNDTYGHHIGDLALKHIAEVSQTCLREHDILARFGGEEFVALLPRTQAAQAYAIAERLRQALAATPLKVSDELSIYFTMSVGIAELDSINQSLSYLIQQADQALYQAKTQGRNRVCINPVKQIA